MKKSKTNKKNLVLESWIEEFTDFLALESFKLVQTTGDAKGTGVAVSMGPKFVKFFIKALVLQSLIQIPDNEISRKEEYKVVKEQFTNLKHQLQNNISEGFEEAFVEYANNKIDYYCQISPVPEPINKEPC